MKIFVYYVGKARDAALNAYAEEFMKRSSRFCACQMREIDPARFEIPKRHAGARRVYLDPAGKTMESGGVAKILDTAQAEGRDLIFFIGAHAGLTAAQRAEADLLLSLSPMTFSHELARAVLAEQIFRGFAMLHNHPYVR